MFQPARKKIYLWLFFVSAIALVSLPAYAQIQPIGQAVCGRLGIPCTATTPRAFATTIWTLLNRLLVLVGIAALIVVIYGGVKYILSMGNEKDTEQAKHIILYAGLGLIVVGLAAAIVNFIIFAFK